MMTFDEMSEKLNLSRGQFSSFEQMLFNHQIFFPFSFRTYAFLNKNITIAYKRKKRP